MEPQSDVPEAAATGAVNAKVYAFAPAVEVASAGEVAIAQEVAQAPEEPGNLTRLKLTPLGRRPSRCPEVTAAWLRLLSAHDSVSGVFDTLHLVRRTRADQSASRSTRGRLHKDAQDLLRAAIVFASAGVDASVQALLEHAVPMLVDQPGSTPRCRYEVFLDEQARASTEEFRTAIKAPDPRTALLHLYLSSKTRASFQGSGDLRDRAAASLGITNRQIPEKRYTALDDFFTARNDVAHRLDMQKAVTGTKPLKKDRIQQDILSMCDGALLLVRDLIKETASNLAACR